MITKKGDNLYELEFTNDEVYIKAELSIDVKCILISVLELDLLTLKTIKYSILKGPMLWSYYTNHYFPTHLYLIRLEIENFKYEE